jgi:ATP-dependent DNA helicase RecQ
LALVWQRRGNQLAGVDRAELEQTLQQHFGHSTFRDGQLEVVNGLLDGRSMLAVFPTGGGKSLCYQLPALLLEGVTLVVSPLIALMKDQVDALLRRGIPAARLDSTLSQEDYQQVMKDLGSGALKLLYVAPERLANEGFRALLKRHRPALVAIDEAHCISEWGHNFRPDYLKLARFCRDLKIPRVLCLTATASPEVARDVCKAFRIRKADHIQLSFHRPNLDLRVKAISAVEKKPYLLHRLRETEGAAVVYVTLQHTAEEVSTYLQREGIASRAYHAGLPDEFRSDAQEVFMRGDCRVIVATIAFGMGIDKADIRHVFHYNLPKSLENYSQETGRAGRDGLPSSCELLATAEDLVPLENFIYGDTPTLGAVQHLIDHILRLGKEFDLSVYELSSVNDTRQLVVSTLLTYLEMEGVIEATRPFYATYQAKLLRPLENLLHGYDARRKTFLRRLFSTAKEGRSWLSFDVGKSAREMEESREKIVAALHYLEEAGDLALKKSGVRQGYRLKNPVDDLQSLATRLHELFQRREEADLLRLRQVVALAEHPGCLTAFVTAHFGEKIPPCGHCARCRGEKAESLPRRAPFSCSEDQLLVIQDLLKKRPSALKTQRQLARFLCGISSPAVTRDRLTRHDAFGLLEGAEFQEVLLLAASLG